MAASYREAPLHKNRKTTLGRLKTFISSGSIPKNEIQTNKTIKGLPTLANKLYKDVVPFNELGHWQLPGGNGSWQKFSFDDIRKMDFRACSLGQKFGPVWSTHWLNVKFRLPRSFKGEEIHLRFCSGSEAALYSTDGKLLGAFSPNFRNEFVLSKCWNGGDDIEFFIEIACNGMFGGGMSGESLDIGPTNMQHEYVLETLDLAVFDPVVFKVLTDLELLYGIATELDENDQRGFQALYTANDMINLIVAGNLMQASNQGDQFFSEGSGKKAHTLYAMGHCHIDTAWLWSYDETIRKCARSWQSQIELMKEYPEHIFTCSQAQQFYWIKKYYPDLFVEIREFVKKGRFIPVGGTWVEMDGLLPSGESFIRQFYYGQKFFQEEFGLKCKEFWLPDTFGYSGQIPQILRICGIERFLTQKLSWSMVNKFPHHNFIWEGIDGSQIMVHFPPGDSYEMKANIGEILKSERNSQDKGRVNVGAYLFGHGDGGGGPTRKMLERLRRLRDVDGLPKIQIATPNEFFERLSEDKGKMCKWVGELYLELHNGTYTTQAKIKWYNRKLEQFLMEVELLTSMAYAHGHVDDGNLKSDLKLLDKCWKRVLLNQFHDVIPGSCIELVKDDAWRIYKSVWDDLSVLKGKYVGLLPIKGPAVFNPLGWETNTVICSSSKILNGDKVSNLQEVVLQDESFDPDSEGRQLPNKFQAVLVNLKPSGFSEITSDEGSDLPTAAKITQLEDNAISMENGKIKLTVSSKGEFPQENLSLLDGKEEWSVFKPEGNSNFFFLFDDVPLFWDAWDCMDYHLETRQRLPFRDAKGPEIVAKGPLLTAYKWSCMFGAGSQLTKYTILRANSDMLEYFVVVDWKESHKFLKAEFELDVLAREATYEIQFGHLKRPTHTNTSWDSAQFEVSGHKWMDISQADRGVTFITDSKYGWHARDNRVQLSLLRSPKSPDANCDMHRHCIHFAVLPHKGRFQDAGVIRKAYEFNFLMANDLPIFDFEIDHKMNSSSSLHSLVTTSNEAVVIESVKISDKKEKTLCVRIYESFGGFARTKVMLGFTATEVQECNALEELLDASSIPQKGNCFDVHLQPFQIKSFLVNFA